MCQICVTIADRGAAEFALGSLIVELMGSEGNWEAIMIGLKALLSIYMAAPARTIAKQHAQVFISHHQVLTHSLQCFATNVCLVQSEQHKLTHNAYQKLT